MEKCMASELSIKASLFGSGESGMSLVLIAGVAHLEACEAQGVG